MGHLRQYNKRQDKRLGLRRQSTNQSTTPAGTSNSSLTTGSNTYNNTYANTAIQDNKLNQPTYSYNWIAKAGATAPLVATGIMAGIDFAKANKEARDQQKMVDSLMNQYMTKPIENPYSNLPIATKAAELKAEETDQALANTLDNLRASGYSAGGATALANAAAKSKQAIASDIEKQEAANARLEAKGREMVQSAEFARMDQQMDYVQSKADAAAQRRSDALGQLAGVAGGLGSLATQFGTEIGTVRDE